MALYLVDANKIVPVAPTTFADEGLQERKHIQAWLKSRPEVISPDTLIVAEEFSDWEDSRRRIDLLGIDKDANLVVIELKRTEDGGHMELQALRYAAMISTMTIDKLESIYEGFLEDNDEQKDAKYALNEFLGWDESSDRRLGQDIKIVLASAEFSKELTTSVLWLNDQGLNIKCVHLRPYKNDGLVLLDVQTKIPVPEAEEYQIRIREKRQKERVAREIARDYSKYDLTIGDKKFANQNKRNMMFLLVSEILNRADSRQGDVKTVSAALPPGKLRSFENTLEAEQIREQIAAEGTEGVGRTKRFFCADGEPIQIENTTYVLSKMWSRDDFLNAAEKLASKFPSLKIEFKQSLSDGT